MSQSDATESSPSGPTTAGDELAPLYDLLQREDVGDLLARDISLQLLLINAVCRARGFKTKDWDTRSLAQALYSIMDEWMQGRPTKARRENGMKGGRPAILSNARAMRASERQARRTRAIERMTLEIDQRTSERKLYRHAVDTLCEGESSPFHAAARTPGERAKLADSVRKVRRRAREKLFAVVEAAHAKYAAMIDARP